ncbi:MAG: hypothetical protein AAFR87_18635 [Bacteroidota bacterium]
MAGKAIIPVLHLLLVFQLFSCTQKAYEESFPYFQGEIEYQYSYESDILDKDSLAAIKPQKGVFRYDLNNYQSRFFSAEDTTSYYYLSETNSALSQINSRFADNCLDYGIPTDSIIYFNIYETNEEVMQHSCKVIEYKSKQMWNQYMVSKEIKISPKTYKDHIAYNWQFYGSEAEGGLILRLEHRFPTYTMKGIATRIRIFYKSEKALEISADKIKDMCRHYVGG